MQLVQKGEHAVRMEWWDRVARGETLKATILSSMGLTIVVDVGSPLSLRQRFLKAFRRRLGALVPLCCQELWSSSLPLVAPLANGCAQIQQSFGSNEKIERASRLTVKEFSNLKH